MSKHAASFKDFVSQAERLVGFSLMPKVWATVDACEKQESGRKIHQLILGLMSEIVRDVRQRRDHVDLWYEVRPLNGSNWSARMKLGGGLFREFNEFCALVQVGNNKEEVELVDRCGDIITQGRRLVALAKDPAKGHAMTKGIFHAMRDEMLYGNFINAIATSPNIRIVPVG